MGLDSKVNENESCVTLGSLLFEVFLEFYYIYIRINSIWSFVNKWHTFAFFTGTSAVVLLLCPSASFLLPCHEYDAGENTDLCEAAKSVNLSEMKGNAGLQIYK